MEILSVNIESNDFDQPIGKKVVNLDIDWGDDNDKADEQEVELNEYPGKRSLRRENPNLGISAALNGQSFLAFHHLPQPNKDDDEENEGVVRSSEDDEVRKETTKKQVEQEVDYEKKI